MDKRGQILRRIQIELLDLALHTTDPDVLALLDRLLYEIEEVIGDPFDLSDDDE